MLFGLAIDFVMKAAVDKNNSGLTLIPQRSLRYPEVKLADLDYADDKALFEESETNRSQTCFSWETRITDEFQENSSVILVSQMSFKKTEILPIQNHSSKTTPAVPLGNEGTIKLTILNTWVLIAAQMAPMLKKSTTGLVKHRAHSENWTWHSIV